MFYCVLVKCTASLSYDFKMCFLLQLCELASPENMICMAPDLRGLNGIVEPTPEEPLALHYGFIMDGVEHLANISSPEMGSHVFSVYPDPKFEMFEGGMKQFFSSKNEHLVINVIHLLLMSCSFLFTLRSFRS